jgi:hypothetical protein
MKNIKHQIITAIIATVAVLASLQTEASLLFNGTSSKAVLDGSYLDASTHSNYTFEVWIKPYSLPPTYVGTLIGKTEDWKEWSLDIEANGGLQFRGAWPNYYWGTTTAAGSITTNKWQHICCAVTNGQASFYVNGNLVGTESVQNPIDFAGSLSGCSLGDAPMAIGYSDSCTTPDYNFFNGLIYGIKVWNRTLAANEVYAIATTGSPLTTNGLYNAVMLNEGSGTTIHDSLTSLTGRVLSASWNTETPNIPRIGLAYAVKPTFSFLTVGTNYQLQVSTSLTGTFTNYGSAFTATNSNMVYPQYWDVANWNQLFFRLQQQ